MAELAFHTKDEALEYAKENGIALTVAKQTQHPETKETYTYQENNLEQRGVVWVIVNDAHADTKPTNNVKSPTHPATG